MSESAMPHSLTNESASKPLNPHAAAYSGFLTQTEQHKLVVLKDDDLYRHLRVQAPGTRMWSWDITTWPGHLTTTGDVADGYTFTRTIDMIEFFTLPVTSQNYYSDGAPCIDVRYWAEKLCGGRSSEVKEYDREKFLSLVREALEENEELGTQAQQLRARQIALLEHIRSARHRTVGEDTSPTVQEQLEKHWTGELSQTDLFSMDGLNQSQMDQIGNEFDIDPTTGRSAVLDLYCLEGTPIPRQSPAQRRAEILDDARWSSNSEHDAHTWLCDNEQFVGTDTWEWDLRDWDTSFLFTCYAIDLAVQLYRQHVEAQAERTDQIQRVVDSNQIRALS